MSSLPAVDWAKALAIIAVLVTHAGPYGFVQPNPIDTFVRVRFTTWDVPVFLMVSGYLHGSAIPLMLPRAWARLRRVLGPYVLVTLVFTACRLTPGATWSALPFNLALGNAHGTFYYVFVWCGCVLTGFVWSRLRPAGLLVALALVVLATEWRAWNPTFDFFWAIRDPLFEGWWLCYLGGWCARRFGWVEVVQRYPLASIAFAVAGGVPWMLHPLGNIAVELRLLYVTSVATVIVALARSAPAPVRWLGHETLWIYLVHLPVLDALVGYARDWNPVPRIAFSVTLTLAICVAGIMLLRRLQRWFTHDVPDAGTPSEQHFPLPVQPVSD